MTEISIKIPQKRCSKCKKVKNLDEFANRKVSKDGKRGTCRECNNKYANNYYYGITEGVKTQETEPTGIYKNCNTCGERKDLIDFRIRTRNADGRDTKCKSCLSKEYKEYVKTFDAER